jgi:hypothetical protein
MAAPTDKSPMCKILKRKALSKIKRKERLWARYLNTRDGEAYKEYCKVIIYAITKFFIPVHI